MNKYPLVEMLAFFSRFGMLSEPKWRDAYVHKMKRIRSCHTKSEGGVWRSFYSVETKQGHIIDLVFDEADLIWRLEHPDEYPGMVVDRVLALVKRHKHMPSRAHRIIPYLFELIPEEELPQKGPAKGPSLVERVQPFRFKSKSGKLESAQVMEIVTRHLENVMVTKHLHYVVKTDLRRYFHLVFILDEQDWRFMQEVDEEFFFVR